MHTPKFSKISIAYNSEDPEGDKCNILAVSATSWKTDLIQHSELRFRLNLSHEYKRLVKLFYQMDGYLSYAVISLLQYKKEQIMHLIVLVEVYDPYNITYSSLHPSQPFHRVYVATLTRDGT